jgi:hypothetical protein
MYYEIRNTFLNTVEGQFTTELKAVKYFNKYIYPKNIINNIKNKNFPESSFNLADLKKGINNWKLYTVK